MSRAARLGGLVAASLAGLAVVLAATGWLYLLRPAGPARGPLVPDALPLDELPRRAAAAPLVFLLVWVAAALLLGALARRAGADRVTGALLLALGVGIWTYLVTAVSLLAVRQVPAEDAFRAAAELRAVYVPAILAGLGGAVLGRPGPRAPARARPILAALVAASGALAVLDSLLPEHAGTLLDELAPSAEPLASALRAPVGVALVLAARGLLRGRRRAWQVALVLLAGSTVLHLLHSDYGAAPTGLLALALLACGGDFRAPGDPSARPRLLVHAAAAAAAVYGYGAVALWFNRLSADRPFAPRFALAETTRALLGLEVRGSTHLGGRFGAWFGLSMLLLSVCAAAWLVLTWLRPWRYRPRQTARERELARELVAACGTDTLAPFTLRADKTYFFSSDERAFLAYRVVGGVAVVSGDPVGRPEAFDALLARFIAFARERDWRIAILGASERCLALYRAHGLRALYHGDEAVLEVERFSLEGRAIRKVRQSVHRLQAAGYSARCLLLRQVDESLRGELESIARAWRGGEPERGFAMALDGLFRLGGDDALFVVGYGPDGRPQGFLHFALSRAGEAISLSSMPRLAATPNGFNEWLVCETAAWARRHGFQRLSLNFAPFAALLAPGVELSRPQRVERRVLLALKGRFQLDNLLIFNRKFLPGWERRFVVYERRRDLPRVGLAALAAEAYLPFTGRR